MTATMVQLEFSSQATARLVALKVKTEASSYAEVVKNALRIYEALIKDSEDGKQFFSRDKEGQISIVKLFL